MFIIEKTNFVTQKLLLKSKISYSIVNQNSLLLNQVYTLTCNAQSSTSDINLLQYQSALTSGKIYFFLI